MARHRRAILDTSVVTDLERRRPPTETERARRQDRLQRAEAAFTPLPFDDGAARAYGRVYAEIAAAGRKPREPHVLDLLIAATALDASLPLYTRNPSDVEPLSGLIEIVAV